MRRVIVLINKIQPIPSPDEIKKQFPLPANLLDIKKKRDDELRNIFEGKTDKFILIIGPCSADNEDAVCEYVSRLAQVNEKVKDKLFIIPRIYTNKPRTNGLGYKGMLHQPNPENAPNIYAGILAIRQLQIRAISESHLTAADEMLYPENFIYFDDMLSYHAIGARSVENQLHRLVSSGVNEPVGMKNPTSGDLTVMMNSIVAAQLSHVFMYGQMEVSTSGNPLAHAILRGSVNKHGENIPNYHFEDLLRTANMYEEYGLKNPAILVDTNHSNSNKQFFEQIRIAKEIINNKNYNSTLNKMVKGLMIESYLEEGRQEIGGHVYGKSITDPCLGWSDTERLILDIADMLH